MLKKLLFTFCCLLIVHSYGFSQVLTLEKCIQEALKNNVQLKQAKNGLEISELTYKLNKYNFFPTLNFNANYNWGFGTNFDFNTFRRTKNTTGSSNPSLNSSWTLFAGLKNHHNRKKNEYDVYSNQFGVKKIEEDLKTNVVLAYFQAVFDQENLRIVDERISLVNQQLERAQKQVNAGVKTQADLFILESQLATEKLNLINQENLFQRDKLSLIQFIQLDPLQAYTLEIPEIEGIELETKDENLGEIIDYAIKTRPEIQKQQMDIISGGYQLKETKSGLYPSVRLNAGMNSNFSSNGIFDPLSPEGVRKATYFDQMGENFSQSLSFSLSVPIFNNYQVSKSVQTLELSNRNLDLELQNQKNQLTSAIQQAWLDVRASKMKWSATKESLKSLEETSRTAKARFEAGVIDFISYLEIINNLSKTKLDLLQSKYDFLLKQKILDLYKGLDLGF